jgi:hypothetical protein
MLKTAVVAPMPSANDKTTVRLVAALLRAERYAYFRILPKSYMDHPRCFREATIRSYRQPSGLRCTRPLWMRLENTSTHAERSKWNSVTLFDDLA